MSKYLASHVVRKINSVLKNLPAKEFAPRSLLMKEATKQSKCKLFSAQAMEVCRRNRGVALLVFNPGTRWN